MYSFLILYTVLVTPIIHINIVVFVQTLVLWSIFLPLKPSTNKKCFYCTILVSGSARPGELLALMGSSGAGKTTLLNSLTFRSDRNVQETGVRAINGVPVNSKLLTAVSAYVQQHDLFIGTLTVREHLIFQVPMSIITNEQKFKFFFQIYIIGFFWKYLFLIVVFWHSWSITEYMLWVLCSPKRKR